MGTNIPPIEVEEPNEETRIVARKETREVLKLGKGDGISYDDYIWWLLEQAAEKHDTEGVLQVEKRGSSLIPSTDESD